MEHNGMGRLEWNCYLTDVIQEHVLILSLQRREIHTGIISSGKHARSFGKNQNLGKVKE